MADETRFNFARAAAAAAAPKAPDVVPTGAHAPAAAPGFRFVVGDRVLDLVTTLPARVTSAYPAAASNVRVYELELPTHEHIVRTERQLEPWQVS